MGTFSNLENFTRKAKIIHGEKYDYSKSIYIRSAIKINIICPDHGVFLQLPSVHLKGSGCKKCSNEKQSKNLIKSIGSFIKEAVSIHNNKFDYSKSNYLGSGIKILIICNLCKLEFLQVPSNHLSGNGCPNCFFSISNRDSQDDFLLKAVLVHGSKYDYSNVKYVNSITKIKIYCKLHKKEFTQIPSAHIQGQGCFDCGKLKKSKIMMKPVEQFIKEANLIHKNRYDYSGVVYTGHNNKIKIKCLKHGFFYQKPRDHLDGCGCLKCFYRVSHMESDWLESIGLPDEPKYRQVLIKIKNSSFIVDGFDPVINTVYEFNGDRWHGNPKIYLSSDVDPMIKKTYGELYQKTINKENIILNAGFKIITMWENDWKKEK